MKLIFRFITASYDRTCKVWDSQTSQIVHTLEGHRNVVYAIAFNIPFSDKIATGSFDKTACLWSAETGACYHVYEGHTAEIVCVQFNPTCTLLATGSMDTSAILWDIETGAQVVSLMGHTHEVIALQFSQGANSPVLPLSDGDNTNYDSIGGSDGGKLLLTGSFDYTIALWDVSTGERCTQFIGHGAEVSAACFSYDTNYVASASMDKTVRIWDVRMGRQLQVLTGHTDEVLDVAFDASGRQLASASGDFTCRIWQLDLKAGNSCLEEPLSVHKNNNQPGHFKLKCKLVGHESEVSKICFNSRGDLVLTASADKTARIWDSNTGELKDVLLGHSDEIFSCAFNYEADMIITGSKDNTCRIWR